MELREPLKTGAVLNEEYRIDQVLGAGGFGITYLAEDIKLAKQVAIKEYFPAEFALRDATKSIRARSGELGETFRWGLESFVKEAQMLARFDHPAITHVMRVIQSNDTAYMVLRYEDGLPLAQHIEGLGRLMTEVEVRRLLYPILEALEIVHAQNVMHRDISPDNIIIRPDGRGVLIDFGAARRAVADKSQVLTGIVREGFSPPEQYGTSGARQGPWTDIYALGAVLYRIVTGIKPPTSIHRMVEDSLIPASVAAEGRYGANLLTAIDRSMRLKHNERPQDVMAFRRLMSGHGQGGPAQATPQPPPSALTSQEPPQPAQPLPAQPIPAALPPPAGAQPAPQATGGSFSALAGVPPAAVAPRAAAAAPAPAPLPAPMPLQAALVAAPAPAQRPPGAAPPSPAPAHPPGAGAVPARPQPHWLPLSQLLFSFQGRINRGKIWLGIMMIYLLATFAVLGIVAVAAATGEARSSNAPVVTIILSIIGGITFLWSVFALYAKRCHDRGRSGWFSLLFLVPILSLWPMIELFFLRGDAGPNRYGPDPMNPGAP
jgi:serine/threonine protein kinase/uncharacterized membrane protein YhaH (DUF805 family)